MGRIQILPSSRKEKNAFFEKKKQSHLKSITNEYCLIRNQFNPSTASPNTFLDKLEIRMKKYYTTLSLEK
tara:strand:- start:677 stop:886 length:210 start_codon:yes stop_codon:yes gene_type:complete